MPSPNIPRASTLLYNPPTREAASLLKSRCSLSFFCEKCYQANSERISVSVTNKKDKDNPLEAYRGCALVLGFRFDLIRASA